MKFAGQTHAVDHNHGLDGYQMNSRQGQCDVNPEPDVMTQPQPPLLHEQGDFPRRDRRNRNPVCLGCLLYESPRCFPESLVIGYCPDQNMGVEDDHRLAAQSDGSAAGSKGSSYSSTEPGIAPMIGMVPLAGGSGDNIATGRPRFRDRDRLTVLAQLPDHAKALCSEIGYRHSFHSFPPQPRNQTPRVTSFRHLEFISYCFYDFIL